MKTTWLYSDPHFGHKGVTEFLNSDGTKLRPWDNVEEMDEDLIENYNNLVGPTDRVYFLGDVVINRRCLVTLDRLNGDKVLIRGNHDIFKLSDYLKHFRDVRAYHVMDRHIMAHIPIHPDSKRRFKAQIHGHLHSNLVMKRDPNTYTYEAMIPDPWYINVCVERTNWKPIPFEEVRKCS